MCSKVTQFYIDIYSFFKFLSIKGTSNWILFLCYSPLFISFIYNSMHLLIPNSQFILPLPFSFDNRKFAFYLCADAPALYHFSDYTQKCYSMEFVFVWITSLRVSSEEGIGYRLQYSWASLVAQLVKNPPAMREIWVRSLGWEDSPGEEKGYLLRYPGLGNSMDCTARLIDFPFHNRAAVPSNIQRC